MSAYINIPPGFAAVGGSGAQMHWQAQAAAAFGVAPKQIFSLWEDCEEGVRLFLTVTGTTAAIASPSLDGAWTSRSVGDGTASGRVQYQRARIDGQVPIHFANMKTSKWLMVGRFKVTTVPGATARAVVANGSVNVFAGIAKATHATKFVGLPGAGAIVSSVSFDTNTHEVAFRNDPATALCYLSVDGEPEVSGSNAGLPGSADQYEFDLFTGALEAQQILQLDYYGLFTVRT